MQNDAKKERQTKKANSKNGYSKKQTDKKSSAPKTSPKRNAADNTAKSATGKRTKTVPARNYQRRRQSKPKAPAVPVKITFLGGLNEIGKNMTVYEIGNDMIAVDCGLAFPEQDMLGIDLVIPDFSYLKENIDRLRGVFITHGHEDHIGALPYLLRELNVPVYGTRLTIGLIEG